MLKLSSKFGFGFAFAATVACGGEAVPHAGDPSTATAGSAPAASAEAIATPAPSASVAEAQSATTASAPSSATASAPPAAAMRGTISGTLTTVPANAAKFGVVYLEDAPQDHAVDATIDNRQMTFSPYVGVVTVGAKVHFLNSDPFPHNVFSPDNEKWDIGQIAQHGGKVRTFAKEGAYTLLCNIHPNMKGYVLAVPSSYFAKVQGPGAYTLKDVPIGTYKMTAWAPGVKPTTQSVTISGDSTTVDIELHR